MNEQGDKLEKKRQLLFEALRKQRISEPIIKLMQEVPRQRFMPAGVQAYAYDDRPIQIGLGQTISQPYMVGYMLDSLYLKPGEKVLDIGTGSGYLAALMCQLGCSVTSIEYLEPLAKDAKEILTKLNYSVEIIVGDGNLGYVPNAPYDAIVVSAAASEVPTNLVEQLKVGGRLLIPLRRKENPSLQDLTKIVKNESNYSVHSLVSCIFVPLMQTLY